MCLKFYNFIVLFKYYSHHVRKTHFVCIFKKKKIEQKDKIFALQGLYNFITACSQ